MANRIILSGTVAENPKFSYEVYGEKFYHFFIETERLSGTVDKLPIITSEAFIKNVIVGKRNGIDGEIRTYNKHCDDKNKLIVSVFAKKILEPFEKDENYAEIDGYVCKFPTYRETPYGREICDLIIASNRLYGKSDYVPSIVWGRNAKRIAYKKLGDRIYAKGRLQSREYLKKINDEETETRTAYELSASFIKDYDESEDYSWMNNRK